MGMDETAANTFCKEEKMTVQENKVPGRAWVVTFAGTAINLCLGILYAWSVWAKALTDVKNAGNVMTGINEGWTFLTNAEAATPFSLCVIIFALFMIPEGASRINSDPRSALHSADCVSLRGASFRA